MLGGCKTCWGGARMKLGGGGGVRTPPHPPPENPPVTEGLFWTTFFENDCLDELKKMISRKK